MIFMGLLLFRPSGMDDLAARGFNLGCFPLLGASFGIAVANSSLVIHFS